MGFIYLWTNKLDGKKYIGRHSGLDSSSYVGSGKHFRRAYIKYGRDSFERIILEYVDDSRIQEREQHYLDSYDAAKSPDFYNISPSAYGGNNGRDVSGCRNGMYGKTHPNHRPHYGEANGMYGVSRTGSSNPNSKASEIRSPEGEIFASDCLKSWCQENEHRFKVAWPKVYQAFRDRLTKKQDYPAKRGNCKDWSVTYVRI
jgi:group I intron endonuclease